MSDDLIVVEEPAAVSILVTETPSEIVVNETPTEIVVSDTSTSIVIAEQATSVLEEVTSTEVIEVVTQGPQGATGAQGPPGPQGPAELYDSLVAPVGIDTYLRFERDIDGDVQRIYLGTVT